MTFRRVLISLSVGATLGTAFFFLEITKPSSSLELCEAAELHSASELKSYSSAFESLFQTDIENMLF